MRLSAEQVEAIRREIEHLFGSRAEVWLFGSRVDDAAPGRLVEILRHVGKYASRYCHE